MTLVERLQATGIRRLGSKGRGFRYVGAGGRRPSPEDLDRAKALRIPPAWKDVAIHPSPKGAVQAVGRDAAGRWQYRYHAAHMLRQEKKKSERLLRFAAALPLMRRAVARDVSLPGLPREKVMACVLRILSTCFLRPGSQVYAQENGSFGLATLRPRHVSVAGDRVLFDFPGKSGKRQRREIRDRRVARIVRELLRAPGDVFKYRDADGPWVDVRRKHINVYIREIMGGSFSAKDFRTWAGTLICACALARAGAEVGESRGARKKKVVAAIRETAETLGNTPAICRSSYVSPSVLDHFDRGRVVTRYFEDVEELVERRSSGLHGSERSLLVLLKKKAS